MSNHFIQIENALYSEETLRKLPLAKVKVSFLGRRFVVEDTYHKTHKLKYNTILEGVLRSDIENKEEVLKSVLEARDLGHRRFWCFKNASLIPSTSSILPSQITNTYCYFNIIYIFNK